MSPREPPRPFSRAPHMAHTPLHPMLTVGTPRIRCLATLQVLACCCPCVDCILNCTSNLQPLLSKYCPYCRATPLYLSACHKVCMSGKDSVTTGGFMQWKTGIFLALTWLFSSSANRRHQSLPFMLGDILLIGPIMNVKTKFSRVLSWNTVLRDTS